jgi:hypothetical protein
VGHVHLRTSGRRLILSGMGDKRADPIKGELCLADRTAQPLPIICVGQSLKGLALKREPEGEEVDHIADARKRRAVIGWRLQLNLCH